MPCHIDTPVRPVRAPRHDGWTPERTRLFFETLAAGHSVVRACARAGLSRRSAYKARRRDPGFAHQWQAAQQSARRHAAFSRQRRRTGSAVIPRCIPKKSMDMAQSIADRPR